MINEESFLDFACPYCGEPVSFPGEYAGLVQECPSCIESLIVPAQAGAKGGKLPLPISAPRLALRRFGTGDWKDLLECLADEEQFRFMEGAPMEEEQVLHWLEEDHRAKLTTPGHLFYLGLEVRDSAKLIGYLSLQFIDHERLQATLNICLNRSFQHQGFAQEAMEAMLDFCFNGIGLHRVTASCDSRNALACKLLEQAGLRREGELVKSKRFDGEWVNVVCYAMLKEERSA